MSHLTNPLASAAQLARCHARGHARGLPPELLDAVIFGVQCLTQAAGLLLGLPQSTTAHANVLLARVWVQAPDFVEEGTGYEDIRDDDYIHASAAAVYLVAKTGARPRTVRDVATVYAYLKTAGASGGSSSSSSSSSTGEQSKDQQAAAAAAAAYLSDAAYAAFHSRMLAWEARLLVLLAFDTHVALPHPLTVTYLQALDFLGEKGPSSPLARRAVSYCNTALLSPQLLAITHQPHELAVAAIYSAARDLGKHLPDGAGVAWWEVFDVDRETLGFLAVALRSVGSWATAQKAATPGLFSTAGDDGAGKTVWTGYLTRRRVAAERDRLAAVEE